MKIKNTNEYFSFLLPLGLMFFVFSFVFFLFPKNLNAALNVSPVKNLTSGLVGYWTFDGKDTPWTSATAGTTLDKSGNGNTGTLTNMSRATSPAPGKVGQGLKFDGANDYVQVAYTANLAPTSAISFGGWFNTKDKTQTQSTISKTQTGGYSLYINSPSCISSTSLCGLIRVGGAYYSVEYERSNLSNNTWYYATVTYDGETVRLYLNGSLITSNTDPSGSISYSSNNTLCIGSEPGAATCSDGSYFNGLLDDVRIYNRALSVTEITSLYGLGSSSHLNISPLKNLTSGLVGYWTFDGKDTPWTSATAATTLDKSGNGNTGTLTNMSRATSPAPGKVGQGLKFDGTNSYVDTNKPLSTFFPSLEASGGSISVWVYPTGSTATCASSDVCQGIVEDTVAGYAWITRGSVGGNDKIWAGLFNGSNFDIGISYDTNKWTHIVWVYYSLKLYGYKNGVLFSSVDVPGGPSDLTNNVLFGKGYDNNYVFGGTLDDVRIYNRALSAAEVTTLYGLGSSSHLNVSPLKNLTSGLVGYWTFDGKDTPWTSATAGTTLDKSGNNNTGTLTNMSRATSPAPGKVGQGLKFDGANDYVSVSASAFAFERTNTFSISSWYKVNTLGVSPAIFGNVAGSNNKGYALAFKGAGPCSSNLKIGLVLMGTFAGNNYLAACTTNDVPIVGWHHVVATYNGTSLVSGVRIYIDGVSYALTAVKDTLSTTIVNNLAMRIGDDATSDYLNASLDDLRIYNRVLSATEVITLYNLGK